MTTIIADRRTGVMAADRQVDSCGIPHERTKIFARCTREHVADHAILRAKTPFLFGLSGRMDAILLAEAWIREGMPLHQPPRIASFTTSELIGVVLTRDALYTFGDSFAPLDRSNEPFVAIGSGMEVALTALHLCHSVQEALEVAHKLDIYTGNTFDFLQLE